MSVISEQPHDRGTSVLGSVVALIIFTMPESKAYFRRFLIFTPDGNNETGDRGTIRTSEYDTEVTPHLTSPLVH